MKTNKSKILVEVNLDKMIKLTNDQLKYNKLKNDLKYCIRNDKKKLSVNLDGLMDIIKEIA
jgi:hypothetical protein